MIKDNKGQWCAKKTLMIVSFIVATALAFLNRDIDYVIAFLSVGFGSTTLVGIREILDDKNSSQS